MLALPLLSLVFAQAAAPPTLEQARLTMCQAQARSDPATAIATASAWLQEAAGEQRSAPNQCLGVAYVSLLRWQAAEDAFLAARDNLAPTELSRRARLNAMAGNAALAEQRYSNASQHFEQAQADATAAGDLQLAGENATDRARALVGVGLFDEAAEALAAARRDNPQHVDAWLLAAALSRRSDDLTQAQAFIETAAALAPRDPEVGLEAGLIAALGGRDEAARQSWRSVIELAPDTAEATAARDYLRQLDEQASAP